MKLIPLNIKIYSVAILVFIIMVVASFIKFRCYDSNRENNISNFRAKVNLEPDIGFIDCIRIQHACLYDHVRKSQFNTILEDCKNENYCNDSFK
jgi:uncharacterized membrane protein